MARRELNRDDLEVHLRRQMKFLRNSAQAYDEGDKDEAVRLASTLRLLLYDSNSSRSLLGQLGHLSIRFIDSCAYRSDFDGPGIDTEGDTLVVREGAHTHQLGLIMLMEDEGGGRRWSPVYGSRSSRLTDFSSWWNDPAIVTDFDRDFSRLELVRIAANQDGGAHVDPGIDEFYDRFAQEGHEVRFFSEGLTDLPTFIKAEDLRKPAGDTVAASIRQIAWEVDATVRIALNI